MKRFGAPVRVLWALTLPSDLQQAKEALRDRARAGRSFSTGLG
jgi:hypothetical protein